jgi:catechol 2,3-dioxygenase-like lactoylglutathione lyase family enzyme
MIARLDHVVLTTRHRERCVDFYTRVLGMRLETFGQGRIAIRFGDESARVGNWFRPQPQEAAWRPSG